VAEILQLPKDWRDVTFALTHIVEFTDDEKERLRIELKDYNSASVEQFITVMKFISGQKASILKYPDHRGEKERMLKSFKDSLRYLESIKNDEKFMAYAETTIDDDTELRDLAILVREYSEQAAPAMKQLIKMIDNYLIAIKRKKGRPKADSDRFIESIARVYAVNFENPTISKEGTFHNVVRIIFEALRINTDEEDYYRGITRAVNRLKDTNFI
jgi:SNF2 family DNA or RNA helicase